MKRSLSNEALTIGELNLKKKRLQEELELVEKELATRHNQHFYDHLKGHLQQLTLSEEALKWISLWTECEFITYEHEGNLESSETSQVTIHCPIGNITLAKTSEHITSSEYTNYTFGIGDIVWEKYKLTQGDMKELVAYFQKNNIQIESQEFLYILNLIFSYMEDNYDVCFPRFSLE